MGNWSSSMEGLGVSAAFWKGKTVLVTGHTGFKGGWLSVWLQRMGANVVGYALAPNTIPNLFELAQVGTGMVSVIGDIRNAEHLASVFAQYRPDIVFHLAAQPLVRYSYANPAETYAVNVLGTVNVLDAVRRCDSVRVCQIITTDKCYENREWDYPYREIDRLGGHDPYSSSKACAELVVASYVASFFKDPATTSISSVRAGNVIGGGDWAAERLLPDCIRALQCGEPIVVRNPSAVRPWQHVLEPLSGYLWLAQRQWDSPTQFGGAWNFGPGSSECLSVGELVQTITAVWGEGTWRVANPGVEQPHEAGLLKLDITKAKAQLHWYPVYTNVQAVEECVGWYKAAALVKHDALAVRALCHRQIDRYVQRALELEVPWAMQ